MSIKEIMKKMFGIVLLSSLLLGTGVMAAKKENIVLEGSTTVLPIAEAFAEYFMKHNPTVNVTVNGGGSGEGAKSLLRGTCSIGNMSRFMKDKEFKACVDKRVIPVAHVVAFDGIAIIVNKCNPVKNLTTKQICDIYAGKIKNWKEVGGPDLKIVLITRDSNSGTLDTFKHLVMKQGGVKHKIVASANTQGSNAAVNTRVRSTKGAIGYVGLGYLKGVKALGVNGIVPTAGTVKNGAYPIARPLYMFTNGYPKMGTTLFRFINIYLSEDGQEILESKGFIPVTDY